MGCLEAWPNLEELLQSGIAAKKASLFKQAKEVKNGSLKKPVKRHRKPRKVILKKPVGRPRKVKKGSLKKTRAT